MLSSGIIDLAIGLAFVFGVTAALASVATELISRFLGLRQRGAVAERSTAARQRRKRRWDG